MYEVFLFVNGSKFRLFRHSDLWQVGFQNGKKDKKLGFAETFSFSISNIACNWVGDTIKRLAAHASIHCPFSNKILTPKQLFDFAGVNVDGITWFFVSSGEVISNAEFLELWFATYI